MPDDAPRLSALQMDVVRVLWARGEATAAEVRDALDRDLAPTTISTVLSRLGDRGIVAARREGRAHVYRALVTEAEVRRTMVSELVGLLFRGRPAELAAHLVREEDVSADDLERLRGLLDAAPDDESGG